MKNPFLIALISVLFLGSLLILSCESAYIKGAKVYIQQNNLEKARAQLNKGIEYDPNDPTAYYLLGRIDGQETKIDDMLKNFEKSLSISDKFKKEINDTRDIYFKDFLTQGINNYNNVLTLREDEDVDENVWKKIARRVITTQEMALKIYPENDTCAELLSRAFLILGEEDKAKDLFENLLKDDPNHISALTVLGNMYFEEGINKNDIELLKKSVVYNERLIENNPNDAAALRELALACYQLGDSVKALDHFKTAIEENPDDANLHLNYGKILYEMGRKEESEAEFRKSVDLSPDNKPALRNLVRFYVIDVKEFQSGLEYLNTLLELEPENPDTWQMMGIVQANLGNKEEAENAFKKAEDLRKTNP